MRDPAGFAKRAVLMATDNECAMFLHWQHFVSFRGPYTGVSSVSVRSRGLSWPAMADGSSMREALLQNEEGPQPHSEKHNSDGVVHVKLTLFVRKGGFQLCRYWNFPKLLLRAFPGCLALGAK